MMKCPCKGCTKRKVDSTFNCHSNCLDYAEYKSDLAKFRRYNNGENDEYLNYRTKTIMKRIKEKNEKNRS